MSTLPTYLLQILLQIETTTNLYALKRCEPETDDGGVEQVDEEDGGRHCRVRGRLAKVSVEVEERKKEKEKRRQMGKRRRKKKKEKKNHKNNNPKL
jgi:hypothetical protein